MAARGLPMLVVLPAADPLSLRIVVLIVVPIPKLMILRIYGALPTAALQRGRMLERDAHFSRHRPQFGQWLLQTPNQGL